MSVIDEILAANEQYARNHELAHLSPRPKRRVAVLTCMDTRLSKKTLGLATGDAHILRNAGGIVTDDMVRSLVVSHYSLGTEEFMVINHTDCGLLGKTDEELRRLVVARAGDAVAPERFFAFADIDKNVREQMQKLRSHPWIPREVAVRGFVYDVKTGRLREIQP
ncbi:MAG TPA: carbonic anhydrase [Terriglobales bacterium]|jgi:carbonic anhydrase|nr:carbonic anhydrase [Terriglobales bacterium]